MKEKPISVNILGEDYNIACNPGEEEALIASARHLNDRMKMIRASGKVLNAERIAVMAALNITHEMLQMQEESEASVSRTDRKLRSLREKVESALNDSNQLEL